MDSKFVYKRPMALKLDGVRYCSWCWLFGLPNQDKGIKTKLNHNRRYLCEYHYKIYKQNRERARQRFNKNKDVWEGKGRKYETKPGTSNLTKKIKLLEDGTPDFKDEAIRIKKELQDTLKYGTSDWNVIHNLSGKDGYSKPEEREHLEIDQCYDENEEEIITFDVRFADNDGIIVSRSGLEGEYEMDDNGKWVKVRGNLFHGTIKRKEEKS